MKDVLIVLLLSVCLLLAPFVLVYGFGCDLLLALYWAVRDRLKLSRVRALKP